MNAREELLLTYDSLADGESCAGELCPACKGGDTKEHTLSVSKDDGQIKWICHRASCRFRGVSGSYVRGSEGSRTAQVDKRGMWGRELCRSASSIPNSIREELRLRYCITPQHLSKWKVGWDEQTERLVIPVLGPAQEELGAVVRSLNKEVTPKAILHTEKDALSWFMARKQQSERATISRTIPTQSDIIIVEDQFSAIRASDFLSSVALLGTHLNEERMEQIRLVNANRVFLALDSDAFDSTIRYCIRYRSLLKMIPVKLDKDLKDLNDEQLREVLYRNSIISSEPS